jgi:AcrR family transcriptional regulator
VTEPTPPRTRLTADARREQIIEAAREVFARSGLAGARTRDLAAEAGINEALLYRHFSSKEDLFEAAVAAPLDRAVAAVVEISGEPPMEFDQTGEEMHARTSRFISDLLGVLEEISPLLGVMLFGDAESGAEYFRKRIDPSLDAVAKVIVANYPAWRHREFDPRLVVDLCFGMAWFAAVSARLTGRPLDREALAEQITSIFLYGLALADPPGAAD